MSAALTAGDAAKCSGILVPPLWAADCTNCLTVDLAHCEIEYEALEETTAIDRRLCREKLEASRSAINQISKAIDRVSATPWHQSPILWGAAGFFFGAGITVGVVYATR